MNWHDVDQSPQKEDKAFQQAMNLAVSEFMDVSFSKTFIVSIYFHAKSWLPARSVVMECLATRKNIDSSGEMMLLTSSCPDDRNNKWRVQAVAVSPDKFESREALPSQWRGLTNDHLFEVAGISGCVFVHSSGFIGGKKSYEVMSSTVAKKKDSLRTQGRKLVRRNTGETSSNGDNDTFTQGMDSAESEEVVSAMESLSSEKKNSDTRLIYPNISDSASSGSDSSQDPKVTQSFTLSDSKNENEE
ncbi:hypothetical protein L2E82_30245 [Cichorium intybus]|uniref:Uncharacterized protein n=1 Tax=Cichorium intybus TaxID=13427 RepID=A0ACB9D098_CICIN|nr:hypothetical protein L2E82_30245 [Cichorium intybus]